MHTSVFFAYLIVEVSSANRALKLERFQVVNYMFVQSSSVILYYSELNSGKIIEELEEQ